MPHRVIGGVSTTPMPRLVRRYGSRKLYDTAASSYVSLDELAAAIRAGEHVQVLDNTTGDDVTAVVLTQIISEEGRRGAGALSTGFLHDLIRIGERISERAARAGEAAAAAGAGAVGAGIERARRGAGDFAQSAGEIVHRLRPPNALDDLRAELDRLRERLDAIDSPTEQPQDTPKS